MTNAALIRVSDLRIYQRFTILPDQPLRIEAPGRVTVSPAVVGWVSPNGAWKIVEVIETPEKPGEFFDAEEVSRELDGDTFRILSKWSMWPADEIAARNEEREDDTVLSKLPRILFELAKASRPSLTVAQFRQWVKDL